MTASDQPKEGFGLAVKGRDGIDNQCIVKNLRFGQYRPRVSYQEPKA